MGNGWPVVKLDEVVTHRKEFIRIDDTEDYKRCRVQLHARGVVLRDIIAGSEIKTKNQQVCQSGEFLVAEIDAKVGGYGIVPKDLDGAIVSSHYFLFTVKQDRLDNGFLDYFIRTPAFRDQVSAQGSTNYAAVRPAQVLAYEIPLPPLTDQRRIVAKIDRLAEKIEEARGLRTRSDSESLMLSRNVVDQVYRDSSERFGTVCLADMSQTITDGAHLTPPFLDRGVPFIFVGNVSSGRFHFDGCKYVSEEYYASIKESRKPNRGDVLYSAVGATLGIPAIVTTDQPFCFQRHVAIIKPSPDQVTSEFLSHMLGSGIVYNNAWQSITGTAQPTIPLKGIRALEVPLPPLQEQRRIVAYLDDLQAKMDAIKTLQAKTAAELDALLPSILDKAFKGKL